jgi:chromosome segregation ATPase
MDKSFILIDIEDVQEEEIDYEKIIQDLKHKYKKLQDEKDKLDKRHTELLKLMNELLKINPSNSDIDNLDDIRYTITQILYNEVRRHTVFPFSTLLGNSMGFNRRDLTKNNVININDAHNLD